MKIDAGGLVGDLAAAWRQDRALLLPVTGLALFLPRFALQLLTPTPPLPARGASSEAALTAWSEAFSTWLGRYGAGYLLAIALALLAALAVAALYLDPRRPTVAGALARAMRLMPRYVLATLLVGLPVGSLLAIAVAQPLLFVVAVAPLFYLYARTLLIGPVLAAEPATGTIAAIVRAWQLTRGHGWTLAWMLTLVMLADWLTSGLVLTLGRLAGIGSHANPVLVAITAGAATAIDTAATLVITLIGIGAYRRLAG